MSQLLAEEGDKVWVGNPIMLLEDVEEGKEKLAISSGGGTAPAEAQIKKRVFGIYSGITFLIV